MAQWDTSALIKLYVAEADSTVFEQIAASSAPPCVAFIARHEARAAFLLREGEGALPSGEAERLYQVLIPDMASGNVVEAPLSMAQETEYALVLRQCLLHSPPVFIRANDALHLPAARLAGETEFATADARQRAAALH